ncbi:glycoside hydrolase family 3 protein [Cohnella caldifontis]|uniref:glycoside hydrolase family 3 protein n=1 Tax=Cohnella caldifontis TaxID=3027471 RepID=UPI0023EE1A56|nr:glycoside hydrolase family 3 protein [Cohnella sp. YIM B05605]
MSTMTLREKIGQLIVTGFPEPRVTDELRELIADYKIGNIILFSHNVESADQLRGLCDELQRLIAEGTGHPAFLSIDQEGGRVTRLPSDSVNIPGAMAIAATGRPELAYAAGRITARELLSFGINFNLAPVLDINNNPDNPVINVRSYGDTAETVETFGLQMLRGLQDGGVLAAVKHFPGHGDTAVDSHLGLPVIEKTLEQLEELELKPFRRAIAGGAEAVMSSHILFPAIEKDGVPGTMSRAILTDLLKRKLGFGGLVVSDCLEMDAIRQYYGTAQGALGALKAGVHLVFISHTASLVKETVETVERAVRSGELPEAVLDEAVEKVLFYKRKYANVERNDLPLAGSDAHRRTAEQISLESVCLIRGNVEAIAPRDSGTAFIGCGPFRADLASNRVKPGFNFPEAMGFAFETAHRLIGADPDAEEIDSVLADLREYPRIVVGLYNGVDHPGQLELANRLAADGHRVTAVALGKPYDLGRLDEKINALAAFEYTTLAVGSLVRILSGEAVPTGKIPLSHLG